VLPDQISESLQDALFDCDWLPFEILQRDTTVQQKRLNLHDESYRVLVVPPAEVIPYATLLKVKEFFDRGGVVVGYDFLPTQSATLGKGSQEISQLRDAIWGKPAPGLTVCKTSPNGGRSYLLPAKPAPEQLQQVLVADARIDPTLEVLEGATDHWLHVLHRVKAGRDVFFIANQNHEGEPRTFRFRITAAGVPECWDAMRNEISSVPSIRNGAQVELGLTMEPNESVLLVFQPKQRALPARREPGTGTAPKSIAVTRDPTPVQPEPVLPISGSATMALRDCSWIWYPEADPAQAAPPGTRYFRKQVIIPAGEKIKKATFAGTADNGFTLFLNGKEAGRSDNSAEGWRNPVELDLTAFLATGLNQLAIAAVNAGDKPNPAGLIGRLTIQLESGTVMSEPVSQTWKTSNLKADGWTELGFNDAAWVPARATVALGASPWGMLAGYVTLSPAKADPFVGHCDLTRADLASSRIYLETGSLTPEIAARVTVNGQNAGGFIGTPARLEITQLLIPGSNTFRLEPFAPASVTLAIYPKLNH
jgi:hypothetical protein